MKNFLLVIVVICGITINGFAQTKSNSGGKFSVGFEAGIPVGNTSNSISSAIGGSLKYDAPIAQKTAFTLSIGYTSFIAKSYTVGNITYKPDALGFIPFKAGLKCNFSEEFYGEIQFGLAFPNQSNPKIMYVSSPGIGFIFSDKIDLGIRYEDWSESRGNISQLAARLAYSF